MAKVQLNNGPLDKLKSRNPVIQFDKLQLFFREPYEIDLPNCEGKIILHQPSLGDIIQLGEKRFYSTLSIFTANTTSFRLQLWEQGIDWTELSDFYLFIMLLGGADPEVYHTFLPDIDFEKFQKYEKKISDDDKEVVLYDPENHIEINEEVYFHISQYLRIVFNINPDEKITHDTIMKNWFIMKDQRELNNKKNKTTEEDSGLISLVSGYLNHPGTKYKSSELKELGVYEFYDGVKRLQVYESTTAIQKGIYSGFCDSSKLKIEDYNFMKPI
jgi:hypothetical protein